MSEIKSNRLNDMAILISTYDGASDLWYPLQECYQKNWPKCRYPIYITNNVKRDERVNYFKYLDIGPEISWSDNILKSLAKVDHKYVLLTFDDLFINHDVSEGKIDKVLEFMTDGDLDYVQLCRSVCAIKKTDRYESLNQKQIGGEYRNATVFSIWKKSVLQDLLYPTESAWDFETEGNLRAEKYEKFFAVENDVISYLNGVVKGKWNPLVKRKLKMHGFKIDDSRSDFGITELFKYEAIKFFYSVKRVLK